MDTFMHYFSLLVPVVLIAGGLFSLFGAVTGLPQIYENSKNPRMQQQLAQYGKNKARIIHAVGSAVMLGFGGWLLYCWIFGPVQY